MLVTAYVPCGIFASLEGFISIAQLGNVNAGFGKDSEFDPIAATVLASVGAGDYDCINSALQDAVELDRMIKPSSRNVEAYKRRYELYLELYPKLISLLRRC
jgi:sugar (pentulose or hexulose) kinase